MQVKILIDGIVEINNLPLECDYECIVNDSNIITALKLPIESNKVVAREKIESIVINQTIYSNELNPKKEIKE